MNSIKNAYINVVINGCFYHFTKAVWQKSKDLGLSSTSEGRHITKFLPVIIPEAFLAIIEQAPETEEFCRFQEYFSIQWIKKITSDVFSCYQEKQRTTNAIEGWHHRLNTRIPKKPTIHLCLSLLKKEPEFYDAILKGLQLHCLVKKRRPSDALKDQQIERIVSDCISNQIPAIDCLERLCLLYYYQSIILLPVYYIITSLLYYCQCALKIKLYVAKNCFS
jgi:hypothetical protein